MRNLKIVDPDGPVIPSDVRDIRQSVLMAIEAGEKFGSVTLAPMGVDDRARAIAVKAQCKTSGYRATLSAGRWHMGTYHLDVPIGGVDVFAPQSVTSVCFVTDSMGEGVSGVGSGTGPRSELWTILQASLGRVSFVGTSFDAPLTPTTGHYDLGEYWTEAYGGYTVQAINKVALTGIATAKPTIGVISCGTNNLTLTLDCMGSAAVTLARIGQLIDACKMASPDTLWVASTCCPYNVAGPNLATIQARIAAVNAALPALCSEHGVCCVNAWGSLTTGQLHTDNIHPSAAGNTQVAMILGDAITMLCMPSTSLVPRTFATYSGTCLRAADYNHAIGSIAFDADQQIGTHSFTMAIWFRVTSQDPAGGGAGVYYVIVKQGETAATNVVIRHGSTPGTMNLYVGAANLKTWTDLSLPLNTWHRFVLFGNAIDGKFEAWLDGKYLGKTGALAGYNMNDAGTTQLGRGIDLAHYYGIEGELADFVFCRDDAADWRIPTMNDIYADYYDGILLPGAKCYWALNEGSGGTFSDSFAVGGAGTVVGSWQTVARP